MHLSRWPVLLLLLAAAQPVLAQDDPWDGQDPEQRAKELYQNGAILYEEGRYEDAVVAWNEAYHLSQRPALLYNIANAQERLGLWQEALDTLNRYRAYAGAGQRDSLDRRITNLERRLQEGGTTETPTDTGTETVAPMLGQAPTGKPTRSTSSSRVLPLALLGGGAVFMTAGTAFGLSAAGARRAASESCTTVDAGTWCLEEADTALSRDRRNSVIADVGFLLGTAGLASGGVMLMLDMGSGTRLGLGPNQLLLSGSFK